MPTSGWLVGPASLAPSDGGHMPCVMMNQYNNGYTFRFAAGNKRVLAAAIDFKQSAFSTGTSYPLTLEISPSYSSKVDGVALNETVLTINMAAPEDAQKAGDLYKAIAGGKELHLGLGPRTIDFALLGMNDGLRRVEDCYDPQGVHPKEWNAATANAAGPATAAAPDVPAMPSIDPDPEHHAAPAVDAQLAKAAAEVKRVAAAPAPAADKAAAPAPAADKDKNAIDPSVPAVSQNWQASHGADLRNVLDEWSRKENVRLNWAAGHSFPVKETINISGSFEQAVHSLVGQFDNDKTRPVARVYTDQKDNKKVLLVQDE